MNSLYRDSNGPENLKNQERNIKIKDLFVDSENSIALDPSKKKFGGVCSGLANFLDIPALWIRIFATIALIIEPIPILISYGIAFWVLENKFPEDTDQVDDSGQE